MQFKSKQWEYAREHWHLTRREIQVVRLVCEGHDNEQMAEKLDIAQNTVRVHLGHICNKVGVRGKASLIIELSDTLQKVTI
jgi:two-component system nitrate/nitrite response regulator NarL